MAVNCCGEGAHLNNCGMVAAAAADNRGALGKDSSTDHE